jgi:hypothetical protein
MYPHRHLYQLLILLLVVLAACGKKETRLVMNAKRIPISGARDTLFMERSKFWDDRNHKSAVDSNRQTISFIPLQKEVAFVTLQNMGGVPLRRDTIRAERSFPAEDYLQTMTKDTNLRLRIDFQNYRIPPTDVIIYIRTPDSAYERIRFEGKR